MNLWARLINAWHWEKIRRVLSRPFFILLLLSAVPYIDLFTRQWVPIHDTFQVTNILHWILSDFAHNAEIPLWQPYINSGVGTNWYIAFTLSPAIALLSPMTLVGKSINVVHLQYLGFFFDELLLLTGSYLLANLLFKSRLAQIFVCATVVGTTFWIAQPWFNFHLFYAFPLSLFFLVRGSHRNELWAIIMSGAILLITAFGNLPYFPPVQGLILTVFAIPCLWAFHFDFLVALKKSGRKEIAAAMLVIVAGLLYFILLSYGADFVNYNLGRTKGNVVDIEDFLRYGAFTGLSKFTELFTGTSWNIDMTTYGGVLLLPLALFGLTWATTRAIVPFAIAFLFTLLFSLGDASFVAPISYHFPGMHYFRHVGFVAPMAKIFLVFIAGFGFQRFVDLVAKSDDNAAARIELQQAARFQFAMVCCAIVVVIIVVQLHVVSLRSFKEVILFNSAISMWEGKENISRFADLQIFLSATSISFFLFFTYAGLFLTLAMGAPSRAYRGTAFLIALLSLQVCDVLGYRFSMHGEYLRRVDNSYWKVFNLTAPQFENRRSATYLNRPTFQAFSSFLEEPASSDWLALCQATTGRQCYLKQGTKYGAYYNTIEPFLGIDPCRSIFKVDYWLPGIDMLYRAEMGLPVNGPDASPPEGYETRRIAYPMLDGKFNKITGCEFSKFQVFSSVSVAASEQDLMQRIGAPYYRGDLLMTSFEAMNQFKGDLVRLHGEGDFKFDTIGGSPGSHETATSTRIGDDFTIEGFSANHITVRVNAGSADRPRWLYYADAWHPFWKAFVNGHEIPVLRANLGFKAIPIPAESALITFRYDSKVLFATVLCAWTLLAVFMLWILWIAVALCLGRNSSVIETQVEAK